MSEIISVEQFKELLKKKPGLGRKTGNGDAAKSEMEMMLKLAGLNYAREYIFHDTRKWRFDFCLLDEMIAIEYEGVVSEKSRHTTIGGFMEDCLKYREAVKCGFKVLRYTAKDYKNMSHDLNVILGRIIHKDSINLKLMRFKTKQDLKKRLEYIWDFADKNSDIDSLLNELWKDIEETKAINIVTSYVSDSSYFPNPRTIDESANNANIQMGNIQYYLSIKDYQSSLIKAHCLVSELQDIMALQIGSELFNNKG